MGNLDKNPLGYAPYKQYNAKKAQKKIEISEKV